MAAARACYGMRETTPRGGRPARVGATWRKGHDNSSIGNVRTFWGVVMVFRIVVAFVLSVGALLPSTPARSDHNQVNGVPRGVFALNWCLVHARSKLLQMNKGTCKRAYVRHGNRHQNHLAASAIVEICRGNQGQARGYIEACQCHNPGEMTNVDHDWGHIVTWAKQHKLCQDDTYIRDTCKPPNFWREGRCNPPVVIESRPPEPFVAGAELRCRDRGTPSGNIGRGSVNPQMASSQSCGDAANKLRSYISERDRCTEQNNLWWTEHWEFVDTVPCRLKGQR
jgi:hypothetical protein